jgi:hypothetical protein
MTTPTLHPTLRDQPTFPAPKGPAKIDSQGPLAARGALVCNAAVGPEQMGPLASANSASGMSEAEATNFLTRVRREAMGGARSSV